MFFNNLGVTPTRTPMLSKSIKPKEELDGTCTLDVRVAKDTQGRELFDLINSSVADSQRFIITKLPDVLKVTQKQFASLTGYTDEMLHTTDRLFKSVDGNGNIQCVMEVWIDRDFDTVDAIEENMQAVDAEFEMRNREKGSVDQQNANSNNFPFDGIIPMS